jgi:5'(3')-deoxyribonucleotidase
MKLFELESVEQKKRPIVYLDMDGVLADMFGQVAKHHGVSHWRKARKDKKKLEQIAKKPGFFTRLRPLPEAGKIVMGVLRAAGEYSILSSPLMSRVQQSCDEKTDWLKHHLKNHPPVSILFDHNKEKYAVQSNGTPNILIDDYETNIKLWRARGGIGILYRPDEAEIVLQQLGKALRGLVHAEATPAQESEINEEDSKKYYTSKDVLKYIKGIHHEYHLEEPILAHKIWQLKQVPLDSLQNPEYYDQDDRYKRVIDLDWDHIDMIGVRDINTKPIVVDDRGWILDGNHRATAARAKGMTTIPAYVPVVKEQISN